MNLKKSYVENKFGFRRIIYNKSKQNYMKDVFLI